MQTENVLWLSEITSLVISNQVWCNQPALLISPLNLFVFDQIVPAGRI